MESTQMRPASAEAAAGVASPLGAHEEPVANDQLLNPEMVRRLLERLAPLGHHGCSTETAIANSDLGLGLMYYSLARLLKPQRVILVGSLRGYSLVCIALALKDNNRGTIDFVDAAKVDEFWTRTDAVRAHFAAFGVDDRIRVHVMRTAEYAVEHAADAADVDLLFIDGDHTEDGTRFDHEQLGRLVKPGGYICFHDSFAAGVLFSEWQVAEYLGSLQEDLHEILNFDTSLGLAVLRKLSAYPQKPEVSQRCRRLTELCELALSESSPSRQTERELAALALAVLRDQRSATTKLRSRLRFLTKSNQDLWREVRRRDVALKAATA